MINCRPSKVNKKTVRCKEWAHLLDRAGDPSVLPAVSLSKTPNFSLNPGSQAAGLVFYTSKFN